MKDRGGGRESNNVLFVRHLLRRTLQKSRIAALGNGLERSSPDNPVLVGKQLWLERDSPSHCHSDDGRAALPGRPVAAPTGPRSASHLSSQHQRDHPRFRSASGEARTTTRH